MLASSFHGKIDEFLGICVDNFENAARVEARAYFLSHCHSDHTQGLHTPELLRTLEQTQAYIYMSEITATIIDDEKRDDRLMNYIIPLKLGTTLVTLPEIPEKNLEEMLIDVTLIPAGHSMGSVMYIFRSPLITVLFTGDFHISSSDVSKYKHLQKDGEPIKLDALYIDTTFISEEYENFPKREESIASAIHEMRKWLNGDRENRVALHTSAKYGYEFVFNEIHDELKMKVYVNEERWRFYSKHTNLIRGVTNDENTSRIHICRNRTQNLPHCGCLPLEHNNVPTNKFLYVHFSAMKWSNFVLESKAYNRVAANRIDVCFPTHCSRSEIHYFVSYFSPPKVIGFPNEYRSDSSLQRNARELKKEVKSQKRKMSLPRKEKGEEKERKLDSKVDRDVLRKIFEM